MIPQQVIDDILNRVSIVDVIGRYIDIKRSGKNYVALCPFHNEKTPSFSISEEKGLYHCFGCGASGNAVGFLMDYQKLSFIEAIENLARIAGVDLSRYSNDGEAVSNSEKEILYKINKEAMKFFHNLLLTSEEAEIARDYLKKRGLSAETIKTFQLGYGGKEWTSLSSYLIKQGFREEDIIRAGLSSRGNTGLYDRFRDRVIFPIFNRDGRVVGFGGRVLKENEQVAKYLNTQETPIFHKGSLLFAFHMARDEIIKKKEAIMVEGYMDVIGLFQNGIKNAVAPLGTSLTESQMMFLKRFCDSVFFVFDGDEAGVKAANRALDIAVKSPIKKKVAILPGGKDPFDYVMQYGGTSFIHYLEKRKLEAVDFKLRYFSRVFDKKKDKAKLVMSILPYVSQIDSAIEREESLKKIAGYVEENFSVIVDEYQNYVQKGKNAVSTLRKIQEKREKKEQYPRVEIEFISLLALFPDGLSQIESVVTPEMIENEELRGLYEFILRNPDKNSSEICGSIENPELLKVIAAYAQREDLKEGNLKEMAYKLKFNYISREVGRIKNLIEEHEKAANYQEIKKYHEVQMRLQEEKNMIEKTLKEYAREMELSE